MVRTYQGDLEYTSANNFARIPSILAHCTYLVLMFKNLTKSLDVLELTTPEGKDRTLRDRTTEMRDLMPMTLLSIKHGLIYFSM